MPDIAEEPGLLFDRVAEDYDRARPEYPESLVDQACALARLRPDSRILEVGCGTGKLTRTLVQRGLRVDAVDPGKHLVAVARKRVAGSSVRFRVERFEAARLPSGMYEAIFSATAFHWVDPAVGWSKAANLLRPGGVLALIAYLGGSKLELDPELLAAWREVLPEAAGWVSRDERTVWEGAERRRHNVSELWAWLERREIGRPEAATLFRDVEITAVPVEHDESEGEFLALVRTTSAYLRLDADRRALLEKRLSAAIQASGGTYRSKSFATLVTARAA